MKITIEDEKNFSKELLKVFRSYGLHEGVVIDMDDYDVCGLLEDIFEIVYMDHRGDVLVFGPWYVG